MGKQSKRQKKAVASAIATAKKTPLRHRKLFIAFAVIFLVALLASGIALGFWRHYLIQKIITTITACVAAIFGILASVYAGNRAVKRFAPIVCIGIAVASLYLVLSGQPTVVSSPSMSADVRMERVLKQLERIVSQLDREHPSTIARLFESKKKLAAMREVVRGWALLENDQMSEALSAFGGAIDIYPQLKEAFLFRGITYYQMRAFANALADLERASMLANQIDDYYFLLGFTQYHLANYRAAVSAMTAALSKDGNDFLAYYYRGSAQMEEGYFLDAAADLNKAINLHPRDRKGYIHPRAVAEAYVKLARVYARLNNHDRERRCFDVALNIDPTYSYCYFTRGLMLLKTGDAISIDKAVFDFSKAIEMAPDVPEAYANRAMCYLLKKEYDSALADFEQAIHYRPNFAMAHMGKFTALFNSGDVINAKKQIEWINQQGHIDLDDSRFSVKINGKEFTIDGFEPKGSGTHNKRMNSD